jgi:hypothetical protein
VVVEASADLMHWQPVSANTLADPTTISDPEGGGFSRRFYRTRLP